MRRSPGRGRAHHLALAATRPDAETAAAIEDGARAALARGATAAAAELLEAACSLLKNGLVTDTQAVAEFKDMLTVRVDETIATERARNLAQAFQKRIIAEAR